jgi:hypothetical protein
MRRILKWSGILLLLFCAGALGLAGYAVWETARLFEQTEETR